MQRLRLIACARSFGGPLIAGGEGLRSANTQVARTADLPERCSWISPLVKSYEWYSPRTSRHCEIDQSLLAVHLGHDDFDFAAELELALGFAAHEGSAGRIEDVEVVA